MDHPFHRFSELFAQLGLPTSEAGIRQFIDTHRPLDGGTRLEDAAFWSSAQRELLTDLIAQDADWAEVADRLNVALRG